MGLVAISTDPLGRAAAMRQELRLGYLVLCDTRREAARAWGVLDESRFGGIATPATFVVDSAMQVRFASVESRSRRVAPASLLAWLRHGAADTPGARSHVPQSAADLWRAFRLWLTKK